MTRPDFTPEEESLIAYIRTVESPPRRTLLRWLPILILSPSLYIYGAISGVKECEILGFMIAFGVVCQFVYYQCKPSWQIKPLIDKYEAALDTSDNTNDNSM